MASANIAYVKIIASNACQQSKQTNDIQNNSINYMNILYKQVIIVGRVQERQHLINHTLN